MMRFGIWFGIFFSAVLSFGIAALYKQPLHWYLLVILVFIGLFIHTIIVVLQSDQEQKSSDTHLKKKA